MGKKIRIGPNMHLYCWDPPPSASSSLSALPSLNVPQTSHDLPHSAPFLELVEHLGKSGSCVALLIISASDSIVHGRGEALQRSAAIGP